MPNEPDPLNDLQRRLIAVEEAVSHLDYLMQQLNEVILTQQRQIESLERQLQAALRRSGTSTNEGAE